jgi:WD40 repeat protein
VLRSRPSSSSTPSCEGCLPAKQSATGSTDTELGLWHSAMAAAAEAASSSPECRFAFQEGKDPICVMQDVGLFGTRRQVCPLDFAFSPDGCAALVLSDDRIARVLSLPEHTFDHSVSLSGNAWWPGVLTGCVLQSSASATSAAVVGATEGGEAAYSSTWHPSSTCFAVSRRSSPVGLYSLKGGRVPIHQFIAGTDTSERVESVFSTCFSPDGACLFGGVDKGVYVWDVTRRSQPISHREVARWQSGFISAVGMCPMGTGLYACGSFDSSVCLYDHRLNGKFQLELLGHSGGITQVNFSPDGTLLATVARQDDKVLIWDLRRGSGDAARVLASLRRPGRTNQRMKGQFDSSGSLFIVGSSVSCATLGWVGRVLDHWLTAQEPKVYVFRVRDGSVAHCQEVDTDQSCPIAQFHPCGIVYGAVFGERRVDDPWSSDEDSAPKRAKPVSTRGVAMWRSHYEYVSSS